MKQLILVVMLFSASMMLTGCSSAVFTEGVRIEKEFTVCDSVEIKLPLSTDVLPESFWFKWCKKVKFVYENGELDWEITKVQPKGEANFGALLLYPARWKEVDTSAVIWTSSTGEYNASINLDDTSAVRFECLFPIKNDTTYKVKPSGQGGKSFDTAPSVPLLRKEGEVSTSADSTYYKMYVADREYFLKMQETVSSKNMYIGLQWCIDLLNKYIAIEEKRLAAINK